MQCGVGRGYWVATPERLEGVEGLLDARLLGGIPLSVLGTIACYHGGECKTVECTVFKACNKLPHIAATVC